MVFSNISYKLEFLIFVYFGDFGVWANIYI